MPQENIEQTEMTTEEAESLLNEVTGDQPELQEQTQQAPDYTWNFKHVDKEIKLDWLKDREKIQKWAEMGYDAPNKIGSLSKELETWKSKDSQYKQMDQKYGEIDKYVRENPQFWDHVIDSYKNKNQMLMDESNPLAKTVMTLQEKLDAALEKINGVEEFRTTLQTKAEDEEYVAKFNEVKKQYPKIDFHTPDESGKSLEYKVLEHAQKMGINSFQTAFRDFYHDELMKMYAEEAKEKVSKEKMKNTKLGLLGVSEAPITKRSTDTKGKSYNDLERAIIEEYQLN